MSLIPGGARSAIGLDVGARSIKAVQMARRGGGWWAESAAIVPRARIGDRLGADEASRLSDVLYRRGFRGRNVVLAAPPRELLTSMLELPPRGQGVPLDEIARMELARVHGRDAASFEFAQWEVPAPARAARATHVMAVACPHDGANAILDVAEAAGFAVHALDVAACAAARACRPLLARIDGLCALLDLGWEGCRLSILHRGVVVYAREVDDAGLAWLSRTLQQKLETTADVATEILDRATIATEETSAPGADDADPFSEARPHVTEHLDAIARELKVSFSYAGHQYPDVPLQTLLLVGGGADVSGVAEHIAKRLGVKVQVVRPSELADCSPDPICRSAALVTAMGLARYAEFDE